MREVNETDRKHIVKIIVDVLGEGVLYRKQVKETRAWWQWMVPAQLWGRCMQIFHEGMTWRIILERQGAWIRRSFSTFGKG